MDNFLTILYSEYFKIIEKEKGFRGNHDFDSENSNIRNDQSIAGCMETSKILEYLISKYIEKIKNG